jgi:hypothetical protein
MSEKMAKVKINYELISNEDNIKINSIGIKNNNKIILKEENITFVIENKIDSISLIRKNNEYELALNLKENDSDGYYNIFLVGKIDLKPVLLKKEENENYLKMTYELNNQTFNLEVNYEVIE